jgi:hypothetical protein
MRLVTGKRVIWMVIALVLSACSTVSNKAPDKLVRHGIQRQFLHDNQFNFNGQIRLLADQDEVKELADKVDDQALDDKTQVTDSASSSESVGKEHEAKINAKENKESYCAHGNSTEDCDYENRSMNGTLSFFAKKTTVPFSGAIDIPHGKFELIPEVRYEASNILFSIKMPMQVDFQKKVLITDIRAIRPFVDVIGSILIGKPVEIYEEPSYVVKTFPEWTNRLPLKELIHAIPKAIDDGYASYDKKAFVYLSLDEAGKKLGARYRVRLNSTREQDQIAAVAVFDSLYELLKQSEKRDAGLSGQADKSENEDYAALQELLDEIREEVQSGKLNKVKYDYSITDFYFDDHGRLLAMHGINGFIIDDLKIRRLLGNKKMNNSVWIYFDYRSHPKFTLESSRKNVLFQK